MSEEQARITTGSAELDDVVHGGIPAHSVVLVAGPPGTGKTMLSTQLAFANASLGRRCELFITVNEPVDKFLRFCESLSFFDADLVGDRIAFHDIGHRVADEGLAGLVDVLGASLDGEADVVVIDSFRALRSFATSETQFRRFLHRLTGLAAARACTVVLVGEYDHSDLTELAEFAVADAVVFLTTVDNRPRDRRVLQILKLRGSSYHGGEHGYELTAEGLELHPRISDPGVVLDARELPERRMSTGVAGLDAMLGGGVRERSATLVAGPSGCGKTILGLCFAGHPERGPGLFVSMQEEVAALRRVAGQHPGSMPEIRYVSPVDVDFSQWVHRVEGLLKETGARRLVVDGLGDLKFTAHDEGRFRNGLYALLNRLARSGITTMTTMELAELYDVRRLPDPGISHLVDNTILLTYQRPDGALAGTAANRAIAVLKARGHAHETGRRPFVIDASGIEVHEAANLGV